MAHCFSQKDKKSPHLLGRAVGAFSLEEDMTLISIRILLSCEFHGGRIVTSCEYFIHTNNPVLLNKVQARLPGFAVDLALPV